MQVYRRLLHLVRPYLSRLFLAMFCMLVVAGATAATAYLVKPVLDKIFFEKNLRMLKLLPPLILLLYAIKAIFWYFQTYLMNYVGQRVVSDLRAKLYAHIIDSPISICEEVLIFLSLRPILITGIMAIGKTIMVMRARIKSR